VNVVGTK
jgi:hypothetical protein